MKYLLDTDIISYYMKDPREYYSVFWRIEELDTNELYTSVVNYSEILFGCYSSKQMSIKLKKAVISFMSLFTLLDYGKEEAEIFAQLKSKLVKKGKVIDDADLMIASIAISKKMILVTHNGKHFERIKDLETVDWAMPNR